MLQVGHGHADEWNALRAKCWAAYHSRARFWRPKRNVAQARDVADGHLPGAQLVFRQQTLEQGRIAGGAHNAAMNVPPGLAALATPRRASLRIPKALRAMDRLSAQLGTSPKMGCSSGCLVVAMGRAYRTSHRTRPRTMGGRSIELEGCLAQTHSARHCVVEERPRQAQNGKICQRMDSPRWDDPLQARCDQACAGDQAWQVIAQNTELWDSLEEEIVQTRLGIKRSERQCPGRLMMREPPI